MASEMERPSWVVLSVVSDPQHGWSARSRPFEREREDGKDVRQCEQELEGYADADALDLELQGIEKGEDESCGEDGSRSPCARDDDDDRQPTPAVRHVWNKASR